MTLNINSTLSLTGANGQSGAPGSSGTSASRDGGNGIAGTAAESALLDVLNQSFLGDAGADRVSISRTATGGTGGTGGNGGIAASGQSTTVFSSGPGFTRTDVTWDAPGDGGSGGRGGAGGRGEVRFAALDFALDGGAAGQNVVLLSGSAFGGRGGQGGSAGGGGVAGWDVTSVANFGSGPSGSSQVFAVVGAPAGQAGASQDGRAGRVGTVDFTDIAMTGENVRLVLDGTARGGAGGGSGAGAPAGRGSEAANGSNGGDGGRGGDGTASVTGLVMDVTGGLSLLLTLTGQGGTGAGGNSGGAAGWDRTVSAASQDGVGESVTTTTYAINGAGGDGGNGGNGTARLRDSAFTGSDADDTVNIQLIAIGGQGGNGNFGGPAVANSDTSTGTTFVFRDIVNGTPAGATGSDGTAGRAQAVLTGNEIMLGGGNDTVLLRLSATGEGATQVVVAGNVFDGGAGTDRITVGGQVAADRPVVFDLAGERLRVDGGTWNTMTGFETFHGGSANDRFLDGTGNQTYRGFVGADRFEFRAGQAGDDRIDAFQADDVVRLRGFGPALDSFAEVLAVATQAANGVLIQTSATSSVLLAGLTLAQLAADDFAF
jgi:hypothetical protein